MRYCCRSVRPIVGFDSDLLSYQNLLKQSYYPIHPGNISRLVLIEVRITRKASNILTDQLKYPCGSEQLGKQYSFLGVFI